MLKSTFCSGQVINDKLLKIEEVSWRRGKTFFFSLIKRIRPEDLFNIFLVLLFYIAVFMQDETQLVSKAKFIVPMILLTMLL